MMEVTSVVALLDEDRFRIEVVMCALKVFIVLVFCCSLPTYGKVESKVSHADNIAAPQSHDFLPVDEFIEDSSGG